MDSSWEVKIAQWLDENTIEWSRTKKLVFLWTDANGEKRRYYPDFYLPKYNLYLDSKNPFLQQKDKFKIEQVIRENNINLWVDTKDKLIEKLFHLTYRK